MLNKTVTKNFCFTENNKKKLKDKETTKYIDNNFLL